MSTQNYALGALGIKAQLPVPPLPELVTEWAAVIPLVCHLASYKQDFQLVGQIAMTGRLHIGLFPKLGVLAGLSRLLNRGPEFLDEASSKGGSGWRIWDVSWGSVFPCANGAASTSIARYALKRMNAETQRMPDVILDLGKLCVPNSLASTTPSSDETVGLRQAADQYAKLPQEQAPNPARSLPEKTNITEEKPLASPALSQHRRYQTLHVLKIHRRIPKRSWHTRLDNLLTSTCCELLMLVLLLTITVVLLLLGIYGTATILLCSTICHTCCRTLNVTRPPGYLDSNEGIQPSYMLAAIHQNSFVWHLFVGDRGVIDTLLNKTMITLSDGLWQAVLTKILSTAQFIQLLAMTYCAGQKGWDGLSLVILMLVDLVWSWRYTNSAAARRWLESEGVTIDVGSFTFSGRTIMISALQSAVGAEGTAWMDEIWSPHPRREACLQRLRAIEARLEDDNSCVTDDGTSVWSANDIRSICVTSELGFRAAKLLKSHIAANDVL